MTPVEGASHLVLRLIYSDPSDRVVCVCVCYTKQPHVLLTPADRLQRAREA